MNTWLTFTSALPTKLAQFPVGANTTQVLRYEDMFHPFFGFFEVSEAARRANDEICSCFAATLRACPDDTKEAEV